MNHIRTVVDTFTENSRGRLYTLEVTERCGAVMYDLIIGQEEYDTISQQDLDVIKRLVKAAEDRIKE